MESGFLRYYKKTVIERPASTLLVFLLIVGLFGYHGSDLKLDASAESIVLENDPDLRYYRSTRAVYGSDDFVIITYTPTDDLLSPSSLAHLKSLRDDLRQVARVSSVVTILDVPLLNSPKVSIAELTDNAEVRTLETPGVDKELARKEFLESPIYQNNLVSPNGQTTALLVTFKRDEQYEALLTTRNRLREKKASEGLSPKESDQLGKAVKAFQSYHDQVVEQERQDIQAIRDIMATHKDKSNMHLGGARMITSDMISFIEHDLRFFGVGVGFFLMVALMYFFRTLRWVVLPMFCCLVSIIVMVGFLGWFDWRITVISSNFISLLLIITMSLTIHLIVRYRILIESHPTTDQKTLVFETMRIMAEPCFYTAITTIVAFCSLVVSDIRPVIDFGWIMTIGIAFAFALNFIFFPAMLTLLPREQFMARRDFTQSFTNSLASFSQRRPKSIVWFCAALALFGLLGVAQLEVENRFIDHFKSSTEIYQGMELIDTQLGGTIPLEFVIDADADFYASLKESKVDDAAFEDPFANEEEGKANEATYWFNGDRLRKVEEIHDYLEQLPEIGKVLSIATGMKVFLQLNDGRMPDDYELAVLRKWIPEDVKKALIDPYLSKDGNQTRITMRLIDSAPMLKRKELIQNIKAYLVNELGYARSDIHATGLAVLYNNLLQSLYKSQILTLGAVFLSILAMFMVLFRDLFMGFLAILPNVFAAGMVLGLMGWVGIPLDLMTITIAAITIGIAVDDTIHYIHRFQLEFKQHGNYVTTVKACHGSIGVAMYYTSFTIAAGFSILALSSFIPTIYFGLLTSFAMIIALLSNLTLLAALLILFKPLGPESQVGGES
ncbi:MAG: MMPL family transporter [Nitrospirales bacterium]